MFAILITKVTAPLIAAMNNGVTPEVENDETYFIYENEEIAPYIITSKEMESRLVGTNTWRMIRFGVWTK